MRKDAISNKCPKSDPGFGEHVPLDLSAWLEHPIMEIFNTKNPEIGLDVNVCKDCGALFAQPKKGGT